MRAIALLLVLLAVGGAAGRTVYAVNNLPGGTNTLVTFDSQQPDKITIIGDMGWQTGMIGGLDFDADGNLWAYISYSPPGMLHRLCRVDLQTGEATAVAANGEPPLQDLAYNPVDDQLYGVFYDGFFRAVLLTVDRNTAVVSEVGDLVLPQLGTMVGLACDADGIFYVHDIDNDLILWVDPQTLVATPLYETPLDCKFSQGLFVDWSRGQDGYHAAIGIDPVEGGFSELYGFEIDGSDYWYIGNWGTPHGVDPEVEIGDLTMMPRAVPRQVIEFEDLFGPCGPLDLVEGPGTVETEGVTFYTADAYSWNIGKDASFPAGLGNPFESDAYLLFAFGDGAVVEFPRPIVSLRFITGQRTNMAAWPTFDLIAGGEVVATFGASRLVAEEVDVRFAEAVDEVTIKWQGTGSSSQLAIDEFAFSFEDWPRGDMNCDLRVDFGDINPFVLALTNAGGYERQFPRCELGNGDINGDGEVDFGDINPFVRLLTGE